MITGTVKFYSYQKGYGFIQPDGGGKDVSFDTSEDRRTGKIAVNNLQTA